MRDRALTIVRPRYCKYPQNINIIGPLYIVYYILFYIAVGSCFFFTFLSEKLRESSLCVSFYFWMPRTDIRRGNYIHYNVLGIISCPNCILTWPADVLHSTIEVSTNDKDQRLAESSILFICIAWLWWLRARIKCLKVGKFIYHYQTTHFPPPTEYY